MPGRGYDYKPDPNHEGVESTSTTRNTPYGDVEITSYREIGGNPNVHYTEESHSDGTVRNQHYKYDDGTNRFAYGVKQEYTAIKTANNFLSGLFGSGDDEDDEE